MSVTCDHMRSVAWINVLRPRLVSGNDLMAVLCSKLHQTSTYLPRFFMMSCGSGTPSLGSSWWQLHSSGSMACGSDPGRPAAAPPAAAPPGAAAAVAGPAVRFPDERTNDCQSDNQPLWTRREGKRTGYVKSDQSGRDASSTLRLGGSRMLQHPAPQNTETRPTEHLPTCVAREIRGGCAGDRKQSAKSPFRLPLAIEGGRPKGAGRHCDRQQRREARKARAKTTAPAAVALSH